MSKKVKILFLLLAFATPFLQAYFKNYFRIIKANNYIPSFKLKVYPKKNYCSDLKNKIDLYIDDERQNWSITIDDIYNNRLVNVNSNSLRIPASNQKILSTSYALDKLGSDFRLRTSLYLNLKTKEFHITGTGDPDLSISSLALLARNIIQNSKYNKKPYINLHEEDYENWWNETWDDNDREQAYGSPITRLAISSNTKNTAVQNPISRLKESLIEIFSNYNYQPQFKLASSLSNIKDSNQYKLLKELNSSPLKSLITLANSESHNFTAEVLLKNAAGTWDNYKASKQLEVWLEKKIPDSNFIVYDASGLSRKNKLSTSSLVSLIKYTHSKRKLAYIPYSFSLYGVRGTMKYLKDSKIHGKLLAKTGTLTGVRSLSGLYFTKDRHVYFSIINNGSSDIDYKLDRLLLIIANNIKCIDYDQYN